MSGFTLSTFMNGLQAVVTVGAAVPSVIATFEAAVEAIKHPPDQETAKAALADLRAENAEGHARLQEKLAQYAKE